MARLSGLSIDTLRYYDRAGLLGAVHRDSGGRRVFDRDTLGLLDVVLRLRRTGMPVEDVRPLRRPGAVGRHRTCGTVASYCGLTVAGCWRSSTSSGTTWQ